MNRSRVGELQRESTGETWLKSLWVADSWWSRMQGLQFQVALPSETGLLVTPCRSIHTMWMRFPITVYFLDRNGCVREIREHVAPWRVVVPRAKDIFSTLEVATNLPVLSVGEQLRLCCDSNVLSPGAHRWGIPFHQETD